MGGSGSTRWDHARVSNRLISSSCLATSSSVCASSLASSCASPSARVHSSSLADQRRKCTLIYTQLIYIYTHTSYIHLLHTLHIHTSYTHTPRIYIYTETERGAELEPPVKMDTRLKPPPYPWHK